jgi:hypothetical protein
MKVSGRWGLGTCGISLVIGQLGATQAAPAIYYDPDSADDMDDDDDLDDL